MTAASFTRIAIGGAVLVAAAACGGSHPASGAETRPSSSVTSTPTTTTYTPSPPTKADLRKCQREVDRRQYLYAISAVDSAGTVTITGQAGHVRCGGADDQSYVWSGPRFAATLASGAVIEVLGRDGNPTLDRRIQPRALPAYVAAGPGTTGSSFFRYSGPRTAITKLVALYHP